MNICGLGHTSYVYDDTVMRTLAKEWLKMFGASQVITGVWHGFDLALAEAAMSLGIPVFYALSYAQHPRHCEPADSRDMHRRVNRVTAHAAGGLVLSYNGRSDETIRAGNRYRVAHADIVLSMCYRPSGALDYAREQGKAVIDVLPLLAAA